ncbi:MAG: hypothetical protein DSY35_02655 [Desulfurobacterium sp.]|nr:MAG: hypothetical protein DSY35_02655 [Desulfurobacterium sp.]
MDNLSFVRGATFYLFIYLFLGLVNSGIMLFGVKSLHLSPLIILVFLIPFTALVLFFGFKESVSLFFPERASKADIAKAWVVQLLLFLVLAVGIEKTLAPLVEKKKLFQIISVFINFLTFFASYWLSVSYFVTGKAREK